MLARYRRGAESVDENHFEWLVDLHEALPELKISNAEPASSEPITSG
jgi:myosin-crossreactive antigen